MTLDEMPAHARLWVHVANRDLTTEEQSAMQEELGLFLQRWSAHGAALSAAGTVLYDRVLMVALDEQKAGATGCSIDKLVGFVRGHGERNGIDWFDRHQVLWRPGAGEQGAGGGWKATRTSEFWAMRKAKLVNDASEVVDPLAASLDAARGEGGWLVKRFDESWHSEMWH